MDVMATTNILHFVVNRSADSQKVRVLEGRSMNRVDTVLPGARPRTVSWLHDIFEDDQAAFTR
jgi:hypothetical protein